jgi:hypothetical protein
MGSWVCEKAVPPQQALFKSSSQSIITYNLQCLATFGMRRRCHSNFHFELLDQWNNTYTLWCWEGSTAHNVMGRREVRKTSCQDKAISNHPVNATVLTFYNVERSHQYIWRPLAWEDQATTTSLFNDPVNATYILLHIMLSGVSNILLLMTYSVNDATLLTDCMV